MEELEALLQQKNELLAKIRLINEHCEGIDNEDNAKRTTCSVVKSYCA